MIQPITIPAIAPLLSPDELVLPLLLPVAAREGRAVKRALLLDTEEVVTVDVAELVEDAASRILAIWIPSPLSQQVVLLGPQQ